MNEKQLEDLVDAIVDAKYSEQIKKEKEEFKAAILVLLNSFSDTKTIEVDSTFIQNAKASGLTLSNNGWVDPENYNLKGNLDFNINDIVNVEDRKYIIKDVNGKKLRVLLTPKVKSNLTPNEVLQAHEQKTKEWSDINLDSSIENGLDNEQLEDAIMHRLAVNHAINSQKGDK